MDPVTTRTPNVTTGHSRTVHAGYEDEFPNNVTPGWPLRAAYTLCQRGKVRKTSRYLQEVKGPVTCRACLRALDTVEAAGVSHE